MDAPGTRVAAEDTLSVSGDVKAPVAGVNRQVEDRRQDFF